MSRAAFDEQACHFDRRAGLPDAAVLAIVDELDRLAGTGRIVEIGCGTGQIGAALAERHPSYVGIDLSLGMLAVFGGRSPAACLAANASAPWPLRSGSARLIFASRAAHRLDRETLGREVTRVAHPQGAVLALGRVERPDGSVRKILRRELQRLLWHRGLAERGGSSGHRAVLESVIDAAQALGIAAYHLPARGVATWPVEEKPGTILNAWRGKSGLGGHDLAPDLQCELLDSLASFARERFGSPDLSYPSTETYEIAGVRLAPHGGIE